MVKLRELILGFAPVPDEEITYLAKHLVLKSISKGDYFCKNGDEVPRMAVVQEGLLKRSINTHDGKEFVLDFACEGEFIGDYWSLLEGLPVKVDVQALEDSVLWIAPKNFPNSLYERNQCWVNVGRRVAESRFIEKSKREFEFLSLNATKRYESFLSEFPHLQARVSNSDQAKFLGVSPESLSRIKTEFKKNRQV